MRTNLNAQCTARAALRAQADNARYPQRTFFREFVNSPSLPHDQACSSHGCS
jgi:hypothetical protein